MALNHIDIRELKLLIQRDDLRAKRFDPLKFSDSSWIDFDRFASLLDVEAERLKTGFLDELGFSSRSGRYDKHQTGSCPQCSELGYHCTFFDLSMVGECPWHRCALSDFCSGCAYASTLNGKFRSPRPVACSSCGRLLSSFLEVPRINRVDPPMAAMIIGYCVELREWWRAVSEANRERQILMSHLSSVGEHSEGRENKRAWQLGFAIDTARKELYWKFSERPVPAEYREWDATLLPPFGDEEPHSLRDETGQSYRSIRRHIYKKFVKRHRKCLSCLLSLDRGQALALKCDSICTIALAFLVWRMSVERVNNVERLKSEKRGKETLRLMSPNPSLLTLAGSSRVQWSYYGFFGLWYQLEKRCKTEGRLTIEMLDSSVCDGFFQWECEKQSGADPKERPDSGKARIKVLYPVFDPFSSDLSKCITNSRSPESLIDHHVQFTDANWRWASGSRWGMNRMFKIVDRASGRNTNFGAVCV